MNFGKTSSGPYLVLENSDGFFDDLVTIRTSGKYKRAVVEVIKTNLGNWMQNPGFKDIRRKLLDLAIVARISSTRMKSQDIDNLAKIVLDALKETDGDPRFLFRDDSQIVRMLVWKIERREQPGWNTDSLAISFRIHDGKKQMLLLESEVI